MIILTLNDVRKNSEQVFHGVRLATVDLQCLQDTVQRLLGLQRQVKVSNVAHDLLHRGRSHHPGLRDLFFAFLQDVVVLGVGQKLRRTLFNDAKENLDDVALATQVDGVDEGVAGQDLVEDFEEIGRSLEGSRGRARRVGLHQLPQFF